MEQHSLCPQIANKYGPYCALIFQYIYYWVQENEKKGKAETHLHDGRYWMYNSVKEFSEHFTYMTPRQIRSSLDILKANGLIITGNFNNSCDRTLWYTVTQKAIDIMDKQEENLEDFSSPDNETIVEEDSKMSQSSSEWPKCQNDLTPVTKRFDTQGNSICHTGQNDLTQVTNDTNNKPHINTTDNLKEKEIHKEKELDSVCLEVFNFWNSKKLMKCSELDNGLKAVITKALKSFTLEEIKLYISRYDEVLNSSYFLSYPWGLRSFLTQRNAIYDFKDDGEKWLGYLNWKKDKPTTQNERMSILSKLYNKVIMEV